MRLLEVVGSDLGAWNMCRNCKNRHGAPMAIEEAVDEMKVTGTATPSADSKLAGDVRIGARGERRNFFVADVNPLNGFLSAYLVDYPIERIADYSIDSLNPGRSQGLNQAFCYCRHDWFLLFPRDFRLLFRHSRLVEAPFSRPALRPSDLQ